MVKRLWLLLSGVCPLAAITLANAGVWTQPFDAIVRGNVFRLSSPVSETEPSPQAMPRLRITLQGITTILGRPQALLTIQQLTEAGNVQSSFSGVMVEGERQQGVIVIEVNPMNGTVRLSNSGSEQTVALKL